MAELVVIKSYFTLVYGHGTITEMELLDYAYMGEPFVAGSSDDSHDLELLDYAYMCEPFMVGP